MISRTIGTKRKSSSVPGRIAYQPYPRQDQDAQNNRSSDRQDRKDERADGASEHKEHDGRGKLTRSHRQRHRSANVHSYLRALIPRSTLRLLSRIELQALPLRKARAKQLPRHTTVIPRPGRRLLTYAPRLASPPVRQCRQRTSRAKPHLNHAALLVPRSLCSKLNKPVNARLASALLLTRSHRSMASVSPRTTGPATIARLPIRIARTARLHLWRPPRRATLSGW